MSDAEPLNLLRLPLVCQLGKGSRVLGNQALSRDCGCNIAITLICSYDEVLSAMARLQRLTPAHRRGDTWKLPVGGMPRTT